MSDLLIDLYRYRQREKRNNLEDWFTECLAAILRSLDARQWRDLLEGFPVTLDIPDDGDLPRVETQVRAGTGYGIPDLVIHHDGKPVILFENKIAHGVAEGMDGEGARRDQLHRYAEWLDEEGHGGNDRKCLIFLTHLTRPPEDFPDRSGKTPGRYRGIPGAVLTWGALARRLKAITGEEGRRSLAFGLSSAFCAMLEDEDMANEFPDSTGFAALQVFLSQGGAMQNLLGRMWEEVAGAVNSTKMGQAKLDLQPEFGRYGFYRYATWIESVRTGNAFLMTGIWFPNVGDGWTEEDLGIAVDDHPQIFLMFGDDDDGTFHKTEGKPSDDWLRPAHDFLRLKPLHEFSGDPDGRAMAILEWLAVGAGELETFMREENLTA